MRLSHPPTISGARIRRPLGPTRRAGAPRRELRPCAGASTPDLTPRSSPPAGRGLWSEKSRWEAPLSSQPNPEELGFDLNRALESIVALRTTIPEDAFTASVLGTERAGNGVVIRETAWCSPSAISSPRRESIWLTGADGRVTPAHALAYDQETGFGLVQALGRLACRRWNSAASGRSWAMRWSSPAAAARNPCAPGSSASRNSPDIGNIG